MCTCSCVRRRARSSVRELVQDLRAVSQCAVFTVCAPMCLRDPIVCVKYIPTHTVQWAKAMNLGGVFYVIHLQLLFFFFPLSLFSFWFLIVVQRGLITQVFTPNHRKHLSVMTVCWQTLPEGKKKREGGGGGVQKQHFTSVRLSMLVGDSVSVCVYLCIFVLSAVRPFLAGQWVPPRLNQWREGWV